MACLSAVVSKLVRSFLAYCDVLFWFITVLTLTAIFVTPLVVILGWCMDKDMTLYFTLFETVCLFVTAFVVNFLVLDGRSNYLEGALLVASYVIIA